MNRGITQKQYLELVPPTEEDARSSQMRILDALKEKGITASFTLPALQKLYPICDEADYNITVSLAWNGSIWQAVDLEAGDTAAEHYGYAADLGSTTVVVRLVNCSDGTVLAEESEYNRQTAYGTDILTRIFVCKDKPEVLQDIRACTMETFTLLFEKLRQKTGIAPSDVLSMVVSGNTTMIHFLLGLDPFCVFSSPYAVRADRVGFLPAKEMGFPMKGCVYCVPGKSNYLGGDILSGMIATELYKKETISVFFDIGTNGELVVGNREFLLCGAGAAGLIGALSLLLCLLLLLCTACGGQTQDDAGALHCTVTVECSTVLEHMDDLKSGKADIVPPDGVLLPETTVSFSEGDTVFDVLQRVCRAQGLHMESTWTPAYNSAYIEGIGNLYEFDCGELSGWMYSVNGVWPDYGCSGYTLHDGDTVVWSYTCDLGRDVGAQQGEP